MENLDKDQQINLEHKKLEEDLEEVKKVLGALKKDDFKTLYGIKKPTPVVVLGMEVACHMMGVKPKKGVNIG